MVEGTTSKPPFKYLYITSIILHFHSKLVINKVNIFCFRNHGQQQAKKRKIELVV